VVVLKTSFRFSVFVYLLFSGVIVSMFLFVLGGFAVFGGSLIILLGGSDHVQNRLCWWSFVSGLRF
jgi:hypothetical protein